MPIGVIGGLIDFLGNAANLNASIWDGEVPRFDAQGKPISPASVTSPSDWPVITADMTDQGMTRNSNFTDPYDDRGTVLIQVWGTSRLSVETTEGSIEALLVPATNWAQMTFQGGNSINPPYVIQILLDRWTCVQDRQGGACTRTADGELLYRGDMWFDVHLHGAISTQ